MLDRKRKEGDVRSVVEHYYFCFGFGTPEEVSEREGGIMGCQKGLNGVQNGERECYKGNRCAEGRDSSVSVE